MCGPSTPRRDGGLFAGRHAADRFALQRVHGGASLSVGGGARPTLTISRHFGARTTYTSDTYSLAGNSFPVLLGIGDYSDCYWSRPWRAVAGHRLVEGGTDLRIGLNLEDHTSLDKSTDFDLLCDFQPESGRFYGWVCRDRDHDFRANAWAHWTRPSGASPPLAVSAPGATGL